MGYANAACLASRNVAALEDGYLEAALDQFMRGTHASDAAADDDDSSSGHALRAPAAPQC
jgi:hypothetical protein